MSICEGNPPVTGGFPSQWASNEESIFTPWRHHVTVCSSSVIHAPRMLFFKWNEIDGNIAILKIALLTISCVFISELVLQLSQNTVCELYFLSHYDTLFLYMYIYKRLYKNKFYTFFPVQ